MDFNLNSPYVSIPGSDYLLDGSLPLSPPQTTSTLTGVSTTVSGNATYPTLSQGSAMHFGGVPTSTSVTHTLSRPVNSAGTISSVPGTAMGLNLPGSRPPLSYCGYMLPNTGTQPLPSWSQPPWPQSYPYGGFMPNQPAPALPVAVSLTSAVAPSTTVPDSQASSSSHGTQVSDHASPLDGLQKLLLDFGESFKAEFSTLSSRMTLLENRVSSHQPSPAKSVECDEREDDELSVSPGSHERAFLTDEDVESSSSPKVSKTAPEPSSKSAQQPPTKETEDPPSLKDLRDKVYTLMRDEAHIPFASPSKPKKPSSTFEASCGISQDTVTSHNSFPESGHMAFALQFINEGIANSASEKVANNNISGFGMSSFSDQVKYKDFDIFDSSLGRLVPSCDKSMSSLLGKKPVDGLRLTQPVWSKTENLLRSASQVLGTAEHFLAATGHLLNSEDSVVPAEVQSFLLQLDKALGSSQLLLMGSIANCTLSKRAEFLENISIAEPLKDSLLKSPLSDKMFGLPLQRVQEELSKNPPPVKVSVQVTNGKRSVNATSSSTSTSASGGPPSSAKKRKNNYGKPQNKPNNSGKSSASPGENLQQVPQKSIPVGGRLSFFLNQWKKITSDCYVLSIIRGGLTLQFKNPPPLSAVPISLSHTQDPVKCQLLSVEVDTMLQKAAIEEVSILTLSPGFYSRLFLVPKKTGGMRPVIDLSILNKFLIVPHFKMETNRSIRASILPGMWTTSLDLSDAYFHIPISQTYRKYLRFVWNNKVFQFKALPFWPVYSPFGFYQNHAGSYSSPTFPVYSDSFLPGRFPSQGILPNQIEGSDRFGHQLFSVPRFPYLLEKVRDNSVSRLCFPGRTFPNQCRPSPPTRGEIYKTMSENTFIPDGSISHSTSILATSGSIELSGRCNSIGTTSHSSASVLSAQVMDCSFTRMGSIDSNHSAFISTPSMVVSTGKCNEGPMSVPSSSQSNIIHRCLHPRLGSISGGAYNLGSLESRSFGRAYQCIGNESSSVCTESFPNVSKESVCHSGHGQHNSCSLSQESGRNSFTFSLSDSQRHSPSVFSTPGSSSGETYCGAPQYSSRHSIQIPCSSKHGVGTTSSSFQSCDSSLGVTSDRSVCDQSQSQTSNICVSGSGSKIFCGRRNEPILERNVRVRLPSFQVSLPSTSENSKIIVIAPAWPKQSWFPDLLRLSCACPLVLPLRPDLLSQIKGKVLYQNPEKLHLHAWLLSGLASEREVFLKEQPSISQSLSETPLALSMMQNGQSSQIGVGYRSAISRTIHISGGPDFGINEHISLLVRSFSLERPRQKTLVPKWDLGLVLSFLKLPPFEPAETIDLRFLSYKCCFLLALASGRRRSEIHAFSISDACLRFNRDKSSVTLLTDPAFLAKNQIPDKGAEPVVIPALPSDSISVLLCPVRILSIYLERTCSLRSVSNSRLFIPIKKGISDLSVKTISTWICKCISLAYGSSKAELLNSFNVKAHDVRGYLYILGSV
ncbi:unnamed protein product [Mytilus edulis]|uniref:Reverse transcriptase domain-containing protein n=1 Tax=Mytilus edulis TaxID=6550 RepID=A0A8S3T0I7_MYTED|nr:unnamed protein product [Mytilus edulis]